MGALRPICRVFPIAEAAEGSMAKKHGSRDARKGPARSQPEKGNIQDGGPISEKSGEAWQPKTIEDVVERVLERVQEGLRATAPVNRKTQASFDLLKDVLLENLVRAVQGRPLLEVPARLRQPPTPLYDQSFLSGLGDAFRRAERAGGRLEARNQLLSYVEWLASVPAGAPPKAETYEIGRQAYELLAAGQGNVIGRLCDRHHKHAKKRCYDYVFQCAKRYAEGRLPWPAKPSSQAQHVQKLNND